MLISLSNLVALRRLRDYARAEDSPGVSVLVPARNEEQNIKRCVESLLAQAYPDFEVIVLDDQSSDRTPAILSALAREHPRLRILKGRITPEGWFGKHWACHQLSEAASHDLILFTDADTVHDTLTLQQSVSALLEERADMVTAIPLQRVVTWSEQLLIPIIPWSIMSFLPIALAHRLRSPVVSAAIGQFILFRRQAYHAVGGHAAVRDDIVDDFALARRTKANGLTWRLLDGSSLIETRMYRNFREVNEGLSKNLYAVFGRSLALHLFVWTWLTIVFLGPIPMLVMSRTVINLEPLSIWLGVASIVGALVVWGVAILRFRFPIYLVMAYPLSIALTVFIALRSAVLDVTGRATWKGRILTKGR